MLRICFLHQCCGLFVDSGYNTNGFAHCQPTISSSKIALFILKSIFFLHTRFWSFKLCLARFCLLRYYSTFQGQELASLITDWLDSVANLMERCRRDVGWLKCWATRRREKWRRDGSQYCNFCLRESNAAPTLEPRSPIVIWRRASSIRMLLFHTASVSVYLCVRARSPE